MIFINELQNKKKNYREETNWIVNDTKRKLVSHFTKDHFEIKALNTILIFKLIMTPTYHV